MPQLDVSTYPGQIFWLLISFLSLWVLMARLVVPRLESAINLRHQDAEHVLAKALELQEKADLLMAQDTKKMEEARALARRDLEELLENLSQDHEERRQRCQIILQKKCAELETDLSTLGAVLEFQPLVNDLCRDINAKLSTWQKSTLTRSLQEVKK